MKTSNTALLAVVCVLVVACSSGSAKLRNTASLNSDDKITAADAKNHIGETRTVCGLVASTKYATSARRKPTFLNLDQPFPRQIFTIVIWESDRPKFGQPEKDLLNKKICVKGSIEEYKGTPEIILKNTSQLQESC